LNALELHLQTFQADSEASARRLQQNREHMREEYEQEWRQSLEASIRAELHKASKASDHHIRSQRSLQSRDKAKHTRTCCVNACTHGGCRAKREKHERMLPRELKLLSFDVAWKRTDKSEERETRNSLKAAGK
jgi:hypothetical protein